MAVLVVVVFVCLIVVALVRDKATKRGEEETRTGALGVLDGMDRELESLKAEALKVKRDHDENTITVYPSGRRRVPNTLVFETLPEPANLVGCDPFVTTRVLIDDVLYHFHAYAHGRSKVNSRYWLYYAVTGPRQKDFFLDDFRITDDFQWTTAVKPWNPLLVKHALRIWAKRPEVLEAVEVARNALPK